MQGNARNWLWFSLSKKKKDAVKGERKKYKPADEIGFGESLELASSLLVLSATTQA